MNEIKCPGCGEKFKIDDSSYLKILEQVAGFANYKENYSESCTLC